MNPHSAAWWMPSEMLASLAVSHLASVIARSAGIAPPRLRGPARCRVARFAHFSRDVVEAARAAGLADALSASLRDESLRMARRIRAYAGIRSRGRGVTFVRGLYRLVGIDMALGVEGDLLVRRCSFNDVYTPDVCGIMSAVDEGIIAGLTGEGSLSFAQRLTEGHDTCVGRFRWSGE